MATGLRVWSQTAGSNSNADASINWAEGQAPSSINDSARASMASMAKWRDDNNGTLSTTGSSAAFTVTSNQGSTGNLDGETVTVQFHATADAAATLAKDSNTAAKIQLISGTNLTGGEIPSGSVHRMRYSSGSTAWIVEGDLSIIPGSITGSMIADVTISSTNIIDSTIATTKISTSAITYAKIQNVTNARLLGNFTGGAAAPAEYSLGDNLAVTGTTLNTKYGPHAWVNFTVSGGVVTIVKSFNVASVVRATTGAFTLSFTNAMTDAGYVPTFSARRAGASQDIIGIIQGGADPTVNNLTFDFIDSGGVLRDPDIGCVAIFGN